MVDLDSVRRDAMIFRTLELGRSSYLPPLGCQCGYIVREHNATCSIKVNEARVGQVQEPTAGPAWEQASSGLAWEQQRRA
jgi:hypothetical protein